MFVLLILALGLLIAAAFNVSIRNVSAGWLGLAFWMLYLVLTAAGVSFA